MSLLRRFFAIVAGSLLISGTLHAFAQSQFDVWTTDQGLPQNSVQDILQSRDGYLWLATSDGLVRFDGAQFTVFNTGNSPGLRSNRFTVLLEDRNGVLWIGTEDSGLVKYADGAFITYTDVEGLPTNRVMQIQNDPDPHGNLYVRTSGGVIRWPEKQMLARDTRVTLPASRFRYLDREGALWFYDGLNLSRTKDGVENLYTVKDGLADSRVTALYLDREGSLWIANADAGLQRLRNGDFRSFTAHDGLPDDFVRNFYEDHEGNLWMGTNKEGLIRLSYGNNDNRYDAAPQSERIRRYTTEQGLSSNSIKAVYEDVEGSVWVGTATNGLNRLRRQIITTYSQRDGLGGDNVYPIYQDRAGNVWMGTWSQGLTVYRDGQFRRYTKQDGLLAGDLVTALAEDREGRLWIGGYAGVCWFKDGKFNAFPEKLALNGNGLSVIYQDRGGSLWFGTDAAGLYQYREGQLSHWTAKDGLPSDSVHAIIEDRAGNLWIGTYGGLVKVEDGRFAVFTTKDGLASNRIRSLYSDNDGALWIGTYDGGLSRYKGGGFTAYTLHDGLFNGGVFQILEDAQGNLWCSCNLGIYRLNKRELNDFADGKIRRITSIAYGKSDGMLNSECNGSAQPAGIKTRDGKLWFPTQAGVAIVDPQAVTLNAQPPPVVIESVLVDREARDLRAPLRIEPGQTNLEIHYTGLSFIKPEQVKFKYKLEGVDQDWVEVGTRRVAYYSHLAPGTYTFKVLAANSDGVWNATGQQLKVVVIPPFWQRWWFVALMIVGLFGLAVLFYQRRAKQWRRAQMVQETFAKQLLASQERERKRIAAELHDSLGQNLLVIKNRALLGANLSRSYEPAVEQFSEITESASQAIEEVREIAYNLRPYHLDRLGLTSTIEGMVEKIASVSGIYFIVKTIPIDGLFSKEAEINLYRIVQEVVNNIVKHSGASEARLEITRDMDCVLLDIQDNGHGFVPEATIATEAKRRGFGLLGIGERVRLLGGVYDLQSTPGQGTIIKIRIGLQKARGTDGDDN